MDYSGHDEAMAQQSRLQALHEEIVTALRPLSPSDPSLGERVRLDRGSAMTHLGIRTPERRRLVKKGFSFTDADPASVLGDWDALWWHTSIADILFMPLDAYRDPRTHDAFESEDPTSTHLLWKTARRWIDRIDNWAHADDLARVYSWALHADPELVHPQLLEWNASPDEWKRRISLVSLIHYAGANSFFLPLDAVLPIVERSLDDDRATVQKAVGWVLREASDAHPTETAQFLEAHLPRLHISALRRATEHWAADARAELIARRKAR